MPLTLVMSAFGRIADIEACLLYPQKRTLIEHSRMTALCQKRTSTDITSHAICVPCYSVVRRRQSAQSSLSRPLGRQPSLGRAFDQLHLLGLRSLAVVRARQSGPPDR